jgi:hypothetical protein
MTIGAADHAQVLRSIERFGAEVIPLIEREVGRLPDLNVPAVAAA